MWFIIYHSSTEEMYLKRSLTNKMFYGGRLGVSSYMWSIIISPRCLLLYYCQQFINHLPTKREKNRFRHLRKCWLWLFSFYTIISKCCSLTKWGYIGTLKNSLQVSLEWKQLKLLILWWNGDSDYDHGLQLPDVLIGDC